jgi:TPR repeat protein
MTPRTIDSKENHEPFSIMASYLKKRAASGDADAQCKLGMFYEQGRGGLEKSDIQAEKWFRLAATQGSSLAQLNLGCFYMTGRGGLERSDVEAEKWIRRSAYRGMAKAQYYLGLFYLNGRGGLVQSDRKAAFLFFLAANQSLPEGVYNLGVLYEYGRGVNQSNKEAVRLYKIAKDLGVQEATERLSCIQGQIHCQKMAVKPRAFQYVS